ncbi:hypothetical protein FQN54_007523, partial [Arachnomyces sp. PD_36]
HYYAISNHNWATVSLDKIYRRGKGGFQRKASWDLHNRDHAKDRGFYNLSLHPNMDSIVVHLFAPDPSRPHHLFYLWERVTHLVEMLRAAGSLPPLIIRLHNHGKNVWPTWEIDSPRIRGTYSGRYGYDVAVLPFFDLRKARSVKVEIPSKKLQNSMNLDTIHWASEMFLKRANVPVPGSTELIAMPEADDLDRRIVDDGIWVRVYSDIDEEVEAAMRRISLGH